MIESLQKNIFSSQPFRQLRQELRHHQAGKPFAVKGISGSLLAFVASFLFEEQRRQLILIVPDADRAEQLRDDCALLIGEAQVRLFGETSGHQAELLDLTAPLSQIETLKSLSTREPVLVVTSAGAIAHPTASPEQFQRNSFDLVSDTDYPFEQLLQSLNDLGFERKDFVEEYGDFAVRGGILDIFPFVGEHPVRIEFWGDHIESIREFDVLSQRSIRDLQSAAIVSRLTSAPDGTHAHSTFFDHLQPNALLFIDELSLLEREVAELRREGVMNLLEWSTVVACIEQFARINHSSFTSFDGPNCIDFSSSPQSPSNGSIKILRQQLQSLRREGICVFLTCDTKEEADRLKELIEEEETDPFSPPTLEDSNRIPSDERESAALPTFMVETLHSGFVYPPARLALFTEHQIFGRQKRRGLTRRKRFRGFSLKEAQQLRRGDYVVHVDYGIGKFAGLHKIRVRGVEQEVMKVLYAEDDVLYVNLNFVNRVQKYSSQEGHVPKLTKLGAPDWERLKARARSRVKDIARELIQLYARRKTEQGFAFAPDSHWQKEMEASFMYEDTPDQARTTREVKEDMESTSPMDRLVCGDVGFGKTEIAVRAAFKAVMSGKQVGVLVPTTILAQQHFQTFKDRLGRYAVRIESLSRFKNKNEQRTILEDLKNRHIDILIGTHRMLSKDVRFYDLGLLIIDEEHRFGVSAKEQLRQLRATVDTLTLTATPIPRTLQFSLMGARDLSIINTPPRNRLPIITEIAQFDLALIRETILKELHRGGQVYFIHDRINDIEEVQAMLERTAPEARFHVAHGQMKGHQLENAMLDFLDKKFDVLICTKIIESGIDIPSVNTIIIHRADRFGLAELYQLRGRVGRSNQQAYAILLTPPLSSLPRATLRRLQAIQEFTELGSGFNLAMRDLEIRGAGNLLGAEQSGFIMEMGFEMYQKIVEEAVAELKEQEFEQLFEARQKEVKISKVETIVETDIEALIPDFYVESDAERLDFYRRLYRVDSEEALQRLREELRDRFGNYPDEVEHLFQIVSIKVLGGKLALSKIDLSGRHLTLFFPSAEMTEFYEGTNGEGSPFQRIVERMQSLKTYRPQLKQEGNVLKMMLALDRRGSALQRLVQVKEVILELSASSVSVADS
jgi:transcription-repair coupling factor (superfamily II helicase)